MEYTLYIDDEGNKFWYLNGELHREGGLPAVELADGTKEWFLNDQLHREDGPAVKWPGGARFWFLDNINYSEKEFTEKMDLAKDISIAEIERILGYKVNIVNY